MAKLKRATQKVEMSEPRRNVSTATKIFAKYTHMKHGALCARSEMEMVNKQTARVYRTFELTLNEKRRRRGRSVCRTFVWFETFGFFFGI